VSRLQSPLALVILDGWGIGSPTDPNNAVARAKTPHLTLLSELYPATALTCSGEAVGLPEGQMGNSEVGHLNMGAGRVVYQELTRISKAIRDGDFFSNAVLSQTMEQVAREGRSLHLMGLLSDGGVHSHITHLYALIQMAKQHKVASVYIHVFLDGRDVPPASALEYIDSLEKQISEIGLGKIATVAGRYYAMDRDKRWERLEKAYAAMVYGEGNTSPSAAKAVQAAYERGETDEFVLPTVIGDPGEGRLHSGDGVIFFNFRPDRARQLTRSFVDHEFGGFERKNGYFPLHFACMTQYDETIDAPVAYEPQYLCNTLGEIFAEQGLAQLRIAETEKYAHVTFFFNGGDEKPFEGEDRVLIPSPKVATYDLKPDMSAVEVTDRVIAEIQSGKYDLIVLNYANCDMVGHTGLLDAAIKAVEAVDACVGRLVEAMRDRGGITCLTADHGNAEMMLDMSSGNPFTAHTTNPVPFLLVSEKYRGVRLRQGTLADIAPTILELAGLKQPAEMTGKSLILK